MMMESLEVSHLKVKKEKICLLKQRSLQICSLFTVRAPSLNKLENWVRTMRTNLQHHHPDVHTSRLFYCFMEELEDLRCGELKGTRGIFSVSVRGGALRVRGQEHYARISVSSVLGISCF
ncbi:hypothetical protein XENORESO_015826 [Xenotaenia resolanae]|uniref:PH domain-containing protein n=1 Tax=Xenotaenia resolanae TaxID=208358 RepID=A0ABV0WEW5_9TELE